MLADRINFAALLSQVLVAHTIEIDNEFEHRSPHSTSEYGPSAENGKGPWLISLGMFVSCLDRLPAEGMSVAELEKITGCGTNIGGMLRWGYIKLGDPHTKKIGPQTVIRPTKAGLRAQEFARPIPGEIEERWRNRFGDEFNRLRSSLEETVSRIPHDLPDCLPIVGYGLFTRGHVGREEGFTRQPASEIPLYALLSKVLLAYTLRFESRSKISLPVAADVLRLMDSALPLRDLPARSGVSKEAISMAVGFLVRHGFATSEKRPPPVRGVVVRLTPLGEEERTRYFTKTREYDEKWPEYFGAECSTTLWESLARLAGDGTANSPLQACIKPYPEGWRAKVRPPSVLPHHPMILHRGAYPDGS